MADIRRDEASAAKLLNRLSEEQEIDDYDRLNYGDTGDEIDVEDDAEDEDEIDGLKNGFDDLQKDDVLESMDSVMDAESDAEEEDEISLAESTYAKQILALCEGKDDENENNADIAINIFTQDISEPVADTVKTVAHSAFTNATLAFNRRNNFIEVVLNYQTPTESEMAVVFSYLEKYGKMLNEIDDTTTVLPYFTMHVVPRRALGTSFVVFSDPTAWYLTSARPGELPTQIKILFESNDNVDNVQFFENDEIDIESVDADAQRDLDAQAEAFAMAEEMEQKAKLRRNEINDLVETIRKGYHE